MALKDPAYIVRRVDHFDDRNRKIIERIVEHGEVPADFKRFVGEGKTSCETVLGTAQLTFSVPLPAETIVEAYRVLEGMLIRVGEERKAAARELALKERNKIAIAGSDAIPKAIPGAGAAAIAARNARRRREPH